MNRKLLEVIQVSKTYDTNSPASLRAVSLTLNPGELLALTGESGSGKTTLLRIIAGLEEPDQGTVHLNGEAVEGPSQKLVPGHPDIRVVFQDFRLFPNISVAENIKHALRQYDLPYRQRRLQEMLALARLEEVKDRLPRMLSGGEQQRAALAKALADEPALLLMDEPFSNLDNLLRRQLRQDIKDILHESGCGVVLVTHDPADALSMADQVALLRAGQIIQQGPPREMYTRPQSVYAARFFGSVAVLPVQQLTHSLNENPAGLQLKEYLQPFTDQQVCIRPESVLLAASHQIEATGQVIHIRYLGAFEEVDVQLANSQIVTALLRPGLVQIHNTVSLRFQSEEMQFVADQ